jgi:hypothetical protein
VEIAAIMKLRARGEKPITGKRRQSPERLVVAIVRPDETLARSNYAPRGQRLSAHERAEHFALDSRNPAVGGNLRNVTVDSLKSHHEGIVATGLDAEKWASEATSGERSAGGANAIERFSSGPGKMNPRTAG